VIRISSIETYALKLSFQNSLALSLHLLLFSKSQAHLPNSSYVEEDKFIEEDFPVDWVSPSIYDFYPDEDNLLKEVSFVVDVIKFIEGNSNCHVFDESPHNEGFQLSNEEISYGDFLGVENFISNSLSNKLYVGFGVLDDNFNFCCQERIDNFLKTFMEHELEKINREKIDLFQIGAWKFISIIQNQVVMGCNLFIFFVSSYFGIEKYGME